ncbi:MAG: LPXTG cell wall anchor domain-containing protein [Clostridia bacterium]|nr:LPXTG cell wall anchor domain-containing protein [Clostridia bacterium]
MKIKKSFISFLAVAALVLQMALMPMLSMNVFAQSVGVIENFEALDTLDLAKTYGSDATKIRNTNSFCEATLGIVSDSNLSGEGSKFLKINATRGTFNFHLNLKDGSAVPAYDNITFYVNIPAGTVDVPTDKQDAAKFPDNKYGIGIKSTSQYFTSISSSTALSGATVIYYFTDGSKLTKTNQSGVYAYNSDGTTSTTGFKGYVSVSLPDSLKIATNNYLVFRPFGGEWKAGFASNSTFCFDDFRSVDTATFAPYTVPTPPPTSNVGAIEGFESCESFTDQKSGTYNKVILGDYCGTKYSLNTENDYVSEGTKSFKVNPVQSMFKFFIDLRTSGTTKKYENITFYVDFPAGTVEDTTSKGDAAKYPDGKYGIGLGLTGGVGVWDNLPKLSNITVTYYFKDGSKLTKTENGIYPYNKDGSISTTGFEGYVSVALKESDYQDSTKYLMLYTYSATYNENLFKKVVYFDDFRCIDASSFTYNVESGDSGSGSGSGAGTGSGATAATSSIEDFEKLDTSFALKDNDFKNTRVSTTEFYGTKFSVDTEFFAQGEKTMKATLGGQGNFEFYVQLKKSDEAAPTYSDLAFYLHLPKGTYAKKDGGAYGVKVKLNDTNNNTTTVELKDAKITYYFKDGTKLEKTGENGIFPYDKDGKISDKGFDGYVAVSLKGQDLSANPYAVITATETAWGTAFAKNDIHFDDFRGVDAATFVPYDGKNYVEEVDPEIANGFTVADFEAVNPETYDPTKWDHEDSNIHCEKFYGANFSLDTKSKLQGKNSLKIGTGDQGAFQVNILVNDKDKDASRFDGVGMYVTIPMGDYLGEDNRVGYMLKIGDKAMTNAKVTYFFPSGKKVTKTGQDGIYSYNESGTITDDGFKGYVVVSFDSYEGIDKTAVTKMMLGVTKTYKDSFKNTSIYLDDIRFVYTNTFDPFGLYTNSPNTGDSESNVNFALAFVIASAAVLIIVNRKRNFA